MAESNDGPSNMEQRLLPALVDEIAASEPSRPFAYHPMSSKPEDGWVPVTFKEFANAINHVAHIIFETIKKDSAEEFPTLGYVGPNDVRYGILVLAAIKAGCKALFVSPRNSVEGQMALFERTNCNHLWYGESLHLVVGTWLCKRWMKSWMVPPLTDWLQAPAAAYAFNKTFEEARWDPLVVLHTSGSTGTPKPIVVKQGGVAVVDTFKKLPDYMGGQFTWKFWQTSATKVFMPMPLFHSAGLVGALLSMGVYYGLPVALPIPDKPLTPDLTVKCLHYANVDGALLAPSILEELSIMTDGVEALKKLRFVAFAGGNLSKSAGDNLVSQGVVLNNCISSTELVPYAVYFQPNLDLWQYFILNSEVMGAKWRPHDLENDIYELVVRRKDPKDPLDQPLFYTFPHLTDWSTGDLFKAHPTLKDHWMYHGRSDNIIVFSNGEKLNPATIEDRIVGHPLIKGVLLVGQARFQPALILEPATPPATADEARGIIDSVWPLIEELNKATVAHGRISKELIVFTDPDIPLPRASKGTVQRDLAVTSYSKIIDDIYKNTDILETENAKALDISTEENLLESIIAQLTEMIGVGHLGGDTDFFMAGIDSLQVLSISRRLRAGLNASGVIVGNMVVAPRYIYANPTAKQLAKYLYAAAQIDRTQLNGEDYNEITILKSLILRYTQGLPDRQADKPKPADDGQTIILTGSTGSLGAYLLDTLCKLPHIKSIIALNRGKEGGKSRQPGISSMRGLGTNFSKVDFLSADLSLPDLGLTEVKYKEVLAIADRIIHNAWPVNFNIAVSSFEPYIRGVRNLVNLSAAASKQVPIIFLSTVGTISNWESSFMVPERKLEDLTLPQMGYGLSKLAGSLILDRASEKSGVPSASIRLGQIAGPRCVKGRWNPQEFLPSLIASSAYLGLLPSELASQDIIDWVPIEDVARLILDVSGITQTKEISDISGYFHCVNPKTVKWTDLAVAIKDHYDGRIKELVSLEDWVSALEKSAVNTTNIDKNPAIKLLDTYRGFVQAHKAGHGHVYLDMARTVSQSETAAKLRPITTDLMRNWCAQWEF